MSFSVLKAVFAAAFGSCQTDLLLPFCHFAATIAVTSQCLLYPVTLFNFV